MHFMNFLIWSKGSKIVMAYAGVIRVYPIFYMDIKG